MFLECLFNLSMVRSFSKLRREVRSNKLIPKENYIVFGIIALVFICIMDRNQRGAKADRPRRKRTEKTL